MIKVKPNIGILGALIRITLGLTLLSWSTAKLVKKPFCQSYLWTSLLGAMHVAEGIVKYCPITALFQETNTLNIMKMTNDHDNQSKDSDFEETVPIEQT